MNLVPVEAPTARAAPARQALELLDTLLRIAAAQALQIVADELIKAPSQRIRLLAGASGKLLIDRQCEPHKHSLCAQPSLSIKVPPAPAASGLPVAVGWRCLHSAPGPAC